MKGDFLRLSSERQLELARQYRSAVTDCKKMLEAVPSAKATLLKGILDEQFAKIRDDNSPGGVFELPGRTSAAGFVRRLAETPNSFSLPIEAWRLRPSYLLERVSRLVENCRAETWHELPTPEGSTTLAGMSAGESASFVERLHGLEDGAHEAFSALVESCLRLVASIAKGCHVRKTLWDSATQEGNVALMRALERFDPELGFEVSTYVSHWIEGAIVDYQFCHGHAMRVPKDLIDLRRKIDALQERPLKEGKAALNFTELARKLGVSKERILQASAIQSALSLEQFISENGEGAFVQQIAEDDLAVEESPELAEAVKPASTKSLSNSPPRKRHAKHPVRFLTGREVDGIIEVRIIRARGRRKADIKALGRPRAHKIIKFL